MTTWKSRIQEILEEGDMTLTELARKLDMPLSTLSDLHQGHSAAPRGDVAVQLFLLHEGIKRSSKSRAGKTAAVQSKAI